MLDNDNDNDNDPLNAMQNAVPLQSLNLNFSSQNMRSINISTKNETTLKKLIAVTKSKAEVVFLSDIRLNSNNQKSAIHDLEKKAQGLGYKMYFHSKKASRGVAILISCKTDMTIHSFKTDTVDENYILMDVTF